MITNHWTNNVLTRGNMNISAITKGFIFPSLSYIIRKKGGGGDQKGDSYEEFQKDLERLRKEQEEIDAITVYVNWNKEVDKYGKKVYVELIENKIRAELLPNDPDKKIIINVELKK